MDKSPDMHTPSQSVPMSPNMEKYYPFARSATRDVLHVPPKGAEGIPRSPSLQVNAFPRVFSLPTPSNVPPHLELSPSLTDMGPMQQPTLGDSKQASVTARAARATNDFKDIWLMP